MRLGATRARVHEKRELERSSGTHGEAAALCSEIIEGASPMALSYLGGMQI